jgi:hypothetical protein
VGAGEEELRLRSESLPTNWAWRKKTNNYQSEDNAIQAINRIGSPT